MHVKSQFDLLREFRWEFKRGAFLEFVKKEFLLLERANCYFLRVEFHTFFKIYAIHDFHNFQWMSEKIVKIKKERKFEEVKFLKFRVAEMWGVSPLTFL